MRTVMNQPSTAYGYKEISGQQIAPTAKKQTQETKESTAKIDTYEPSSTKAKQVMGAGAVIDKGTAAHTTIFVDRGTFDKIANYSTYNEECQWEELGVDGDKRWVVVNGQRFECPLSEEEKRAKKQGSKTLLDYMRDAEEERKKLEDMNEVTFPPSEEDAKNHPKIEALKNNEPVMKMLSEIAKYSGGIKLYV